MSIVKEEKEKCRKEEEQRKAGCMKPSYRNYWPTERMPHSNQFRKTFADRNTSDAIAMLLSLDFIFVNTKKNTQVGSPLNVPFHDLHNTPQVYSVY
jgi:hypothetical protein